MTDRKAPLTIFSIRKSAKEGQGSFWTRVGTMFPHRSGQGFNLRLDAIPLGGDLVALPKSYGAEPEGEEPHNELSEPIDG